MKKLVVAVVASTILISSPAGQLKASADNFAKDIEQILDKYGPATATSDLDSYFSRMSYPTPPNIDFESKAKADLLKGEKARAASEFLLASAEPYSTGNFERAKLLMTQGFDLANQLPEPEKNAFINRVVLFQNNSWGGSSSSDRSDINEWMAKQALKLQAKISQPDQKQALKLTMVIITALSRQQRYQEGIALATRAYTQVKTTGDRKSQVQLRRIMQSLYQSAGEQDAFEKILLADLANARKSQSVGDELDTLKDLISNSTANRATYRTELLSLLTNLSASPKPLSPEDLSAVNRLSTDYWFDARIQDQQFSTQLLKAIVKIRLKQGQLDYSVMRQVQDLMNSLARQGQREEALAIGKAVLEHSAGVERHDQAGLKDTYDRLLKNDSTKPDKIGQSTEAERAAMIKAAQGEADKALIKARERAEVDPNGLFFALLRSSSIYAMNDKQLSWKLYKEAVAKIPTLEMGGDAFEDHYDRGFLSASLALLSSSNTKADEQLITDSVIEFERKVSTKRRGALEHYELERMLEYYIDRGRSADAEAFVAKLISSRQQYKPSLVPEALQLQARLFARERNPERAISTYKQLVEYYRHNKAANNEQISALIQLSTAYLSANQADAALPVITEAIDAAAAQGDKSRPYESMMPSLLALQVQALVKTNNLDEANKVVLKTAESLSKTGVGRTWRRDIDDLSSPLLRRYQEQALYDKGEALLSAIYATQVKQFGAKSIEAINARMRLAETYADHAAAAEIKEPNSQTAKTLRAQANADFDAAIADLKSMQGENSTAVKAAIERKNRANGGTPNFPKWSSLNDISAPFSYMGTGNPIPAAKNGLRQHLSFPVKKDMKYQKPSRIPLTYAVFGNTEVVLMGRSWTSSADSSIDDADMPQAAKGAVGSHGIVELADMAKVQGDIIAADILMRQSVIEISHDLISDDQVPKPMPLQAASTSAKFVKDLGKVIVNNGETLTLSPGRYSASQFIVNSGGKVITTGSSMTIIELKVNRDPKSVTALPGTADVEFKTGASVNDGGKPVNLMFNISGAALVQSDGKSRTCAVLYAPDSIVSLKGNSKWFGSIVADHVFLTDEASVIFDKRLTPSETEKWLTLQQKP